MVIPKSNKEREGKGTCKDIERGYFPSSKENGGTGAFRAIAMNESGTSERTDMKDCSREWEVQIASGMPIILDAIILDGNPESIIGLSTAPCNRLEAAPTPDVNSDRWR